MNTEEYFATIKKYGAALSKWAEQFVNFNGYDDICTQKKVKI